MPTGASHPAGCSANVIFSNPLVEINLSFWGFQNHSAPHYLSQVYHIILGWPTHYFLKTTCLFSGQPPAKHHGCKSGDQFGTQSAGVHERCTQRCLLGSWLLPKSQWQVVHPATVGLTSSLCHTSNRCLCAFTPGHPLCSKHLPAWTH